tara:strand:- start:2398 stop:3321 length:924 start_codon:yes stop_codon:yes gene_type:complete
MRMIFMGTPTFSVPALKMLSSQYQIVAVYTQSPKHAGRGKRQTKTQIHKCAEALGLSVLTPFNFKDHGVISEFVNLKPDIVVVAAYGLLLPDKVIGYPRYGCFNIHASLLPRWRGAAPIERAIISGDKQTGITIMRMDSGLDTGPILSISSLAITDKTTAGDLHYLMSKIGADLICYAVKLVLAGQASETSQPELGITYAKKIQKSELKLDFAMPAKDVLRKIHGFSPKPGAFVCFNGDRIKVLAAELVDKPLSKLITPGVVLDKNLTVACEHGAIRLLKVQRTGKKVMDVDAFLRGVSVPIGTSFF